MRWLLLVVALPVTAALAAEEEVTFRNGEVSLAGTLTLPAGEGRHPAVVFLHGSGPMTREGAAPYAERFAELGLASLRFDKRGTGESGGAWTSASLADLARDGLAALAYLQRRSEVDPGRIGFWGVSQAGWVATQATEFSDQIAFMVVISGGGVSPYESEIFSYRTALEHGGVEGEAFDAAMRTVEIYMSYLGSGEGREAARQAIEAAKPEPWYRYLNLERIFPSSEEGRSLWSWVANWDPAPLAQRVRFPVLVMFGLRDDQTPAQASIDAWRESLERAGNTTFDIEVFPEAGHGIRLWQGGHRAGGHRPPFAPGYHEKMEEWLLRRVVEKRVSR